MHRALARFRQSLSQSREQGEIYRFIKDGNIPVSADELLRSQIVSSVAAFDKLMHDVIRIGMVGIFMGSRPPTAKYLAEAISMEMHIGLANATMPPKEVIFEQAVFQKLSKLAFQDPDKVSEGLSLIWLEKHKWEVIGQRMGRDRSSARTELKLIAQRRHGIVHESDIDPVTELKRPIEKQDAAEITDFLDSCGHAIHDCVS